MHEWGHLHGCEEMLKFIVLRFSRAQAQQYKEVSVVFRDSPYITSGIFAKTLFQRVH